MSPPDRDALNAHERATLMQISPVRVDPRVLRAASTQPPTGDDPAFIAAFGRALRSTRAVMGAAACQPFILPGSGTLGMEAMLVNWLAPGDGVLVATTGFWGDRLVEIARHHGLEATAVAAAPGAGIDLGAVDAALAAGAFKALAWTHVDSSTGVAADCGAMAALAKRHGVLSLVDGVAGAGAEPFAQDAAGVDVYLTASPKGLACLAGQILLTASGAAMAALLPRPAVYSVDLNRWLPVMQALEAGQFGYFNTPATNLTLALAVGLDLVLEEGLEARWDRHGRLARALHAGLDALGLAVVAAPGVRSRVCTTVRYPAGHGRELLATLKAEGVVLAGGYHPTLGPETFRIGHLGWVTAGDVMTTIGALARAIAPEKAGAAAQATSDALAGRVLTEA